ncbi:hypothetical protein, partial [Pseudorhizobium pelagicum]|uniref:hypothetical protein n=1 Tax=Pseudorhizobium pelagicum TaxID=1509405 RepID=UPI000560C871
QASSANATDFFNSLLGATPQPEPNSLLPLNGTSIRVEDDQESELAHEAMCILRLAVCMATQVGQELERCQILFGALPSLQAELTILSPGPASRQELRQTAHR